MEAGWIRSRRWDLTWLIGSVIVVPLAPLMYWMGMSPSGVAYVIMIAVGGPHVAVTFTRTNMDPKFVRHHSTLARMVFLIPLLTAAFALLHEALFLTFFFTWASLHVLQQIAYLGNCYTNRQHFKPSRLEQVVEWGLIFSCLYPFATVRMAEGTFMLDGTQLLVPAWIVGDALTWAAFGVFGLFLASWIVFLARRLRRGTLHFGKTALIGATVLATFFTPLFPNLDVAFQGINFWHCIQYLALVWWANRIRRERGETEVPFLRAISERGWRGFARYYGGAVAVTAVLALLMIGVSHVIESIRGRPSELLTYYMIGKGLLLAHYYYDTFLFTQEDELTRPDAVPAGAVLAFE
jgi:hypothetical protein